MRTRGTAAKVTGAAMLAVVLTACGAGGSGADPGSGADSHKGGSKPVALTVDTTVRKATWTSGNAKHRLTLAPERLARGTAADLEGVQLDGDLRGMVPYYLTVRYTNTGPKALTRLGPQDDFTVTLADGTPGKVVSLWNTNTLATRSRSRIPDGCDKAGPASAAPHATVTVCQLIMLPGGHEPATVAYSDDNGGTLLWNVGDGKGDGDGLLPAGSTAETSWDDDTTEGIAVPIHATPRSVRAGSLADLRGYDLHDTSKNTVPWYVTITYRNAGEQTLLPVMGDQVGVRSAGGHEARPLALLDLSFSGAGDGIDQCRGKIPNTRLKPDSTLTLCTIHLLPKGDRPAMVSFEGAGKSVKPVLWRAG